jgi:flagellar basal-body rod modification protein FlgD
MSNTDLLSSGSSVQTGSLSASGASGTSSTKTSSDASQTQLSSDINFFLKMLTTQLKNQDPTQPLDTNQFTQQIAQYSGVQQQVNTNANLEKLLTATKQSSGTTAVSYLGREVETKGDSGEVSGGQGAFSYILPRAAATVDISIKNASGATVFTGKGDTKEGRNLVVWDGKDSEGAQQPDGKYTITVKAKGSDTKDIAVETRAVALVSGVEMDTTGNTFLTTPSGNKLNFNDIIAVRDPTRAALNS